MFNLLPSGAVHKCFFTVLQRRRLVLRHARCTSHFHWERGFGAHGDTSAQLILYYANISKVYPVARQAEINERTRRVPMWTMTPEVARATFNNCNAGAIFQQRRSLALGFSDVTIFAQLFQSLSIQCPATLVPKIEVPKRFGYCQPLQACHDPQCCRIHLSGTSPDSLLVFTPTDFSMQAEMPRKRRFVHAAWATGLKNGTRLCTLHCWTRQAVPQESQMMFVLTTGRGHLQASTLSGKVRWRVYANGCFMASVHGRH